MKQAICLIYIVVSLLGAACVPTMQNPAAGANDVGVGAYPSEVDEILDGSEALARDAAAYADYYGIELAEAIQRLELQQTINVGDIQPALETDLRDTYAGLWLQHQPDFRVVIGLTEGNEKTVQPYIEGKPWADRVEVRLVDHSLVELHQAREEISEAAAQLDLGVMASSLDVMNNRVELVVGNPDTFRQELMAAGFEVPASVTILAADPDRDLPNTNEGVLVEAITADGRTIYLPVQAPAYSSMTAELEGTLLEVDGCLRVVTQGSADGSLVIWPFGSELRLDGDGIEVINAEGQVVSQVGQPVRMGGGGMESASSMGSYDELIPGMPLANCPGPYWIASHLETMAEQAVPDIYVDPFSSNGQILMYFTYQSQPAREEGVLSGELILDGQKCLRVEEYAIFWSPGVFPREEPLRLVRQGEEEIARIGDRIELTGGEKTADDYRFFQQKVRCPGPYWGVGEVSRPD